MITNEAQDGSTEAHLARFVEASANLQAAAGENPTSLQQLEIDAVRAQVDDLRADLRRRASPPAAH